MEQNYIFRQVDRSIAGAVAFPFNRARRFELVGGFRNISFQQEIETTIYSAYSGYLYDYNKEKLDSPYKAMNLGEVSGAFVHDTSVFSATSPILGRRWRAELGGTAGSLNYATVLGDFRQYVMPVRPFTLAARLMHYSRLGSGAIDERVYPMFLGYPGLVRGYDSYSFDGSECGFTEENPTACPAYDRLFGTRLLIGNVELRFPLLGLFGGSRYYGPFPIEGAVFYDTGIAWGDQLRQQADGTYQKVASKFKLTGPERGRVASYGATVRVNLFGFAIVEIDYVKPLDRPMKKSLWQFNFTPGF
jgi:outer membrane protein assembly factor BamA